MAFGIDVYDRYQDVTDWRRVRDAGVRFCIIKATDGGGRAFAPADALVRGARSVGIPVGLYHYAQLSPSPEIQADVLATEVRRLGPIQLPPVLDLEGDFHLKAGDSPATRTQKIGRAVEFGRRFLGRLASGDGRVMVYANTSLLAQLRPHTWGLPGLLVWAADYGPNDGRRHPDLSPYTGPVAIHQYTDRGHVPGIAGAVDLNESLIDILEDDMPNAEEIAGVLDGYYIARKAKYGVENADKHDLGAAIFDLEEVIGGYYAARAGKYGESDAGGHPIGAAVFAIEETVTNGAVTQPLDYDRLADALLRRIAAALAPSGQPDH